MKPRLHVLGLPHTQTVVEAMTVCAFTQKVVKFGEMMTNLGYEIFLYSGDQNDTVCTEHVPLFTTERQREWYPNLEPNLLPTVATWDPSHVHWREMNAAAVVEISKRIEPGDIILILAGWAQRPIVDAFPNNISVEWAAGYEGWYLPYVCFESYAWRHYCYGQHYGQGQRDFGDGRNYDTVIPNYFRERDFRFVPRHERDDYLLFVGRVTQRKGVQIAAEVAKATDRRLIVAGSGVSESGPGYLVCDGGALRIEAPKLEYFGVAGVEDRNELMGHAHAILVPTTYIEPFGAVAVEAQMCGTPALTNDWGAFTETVPEGQGFRCSTLQEYVDAVERCDGLDLGLLRNRAVSSYSLDAIGPLYDRWLRQVAGLYHGGWYTLEDPVPSVNSTGHTSEE